MEYKAPGMPFIILKSAVAVKEGIIIPCEEYGWIIGDAVRQYMQKIRNSVDGILTDNPFIYESSGKKIIILDSCLKISLNPEVLKSISKRSVIIICTEKAEREKIKMLQHKGIQIIIVQGENEEVDLRQAVRKIGSTGIDRLLVEGSCRLKQCILNDGLADKILCFSGPRIFEGENRRYPSNSESDTNSKLCYKKIELKDIQCIKSGHDLVVEGYIKK